MRGVATWALGLSLLACKGTPNGARLDDGGAATAHVPREAGMPSPLAALPYLTQRPVSPADVGKSGLQTNDYERSDRSLRLHVDGTNEAVMLDPQGNVAWRWKLTTPHREIRPGMIIGWGFAGLLDSGELFVIDNYERVMKLAPDSTVRWESDVAAHHNAFFAPNGDIYLPTATFRMIDVAKTKRVIIDDGIAVLDSSGKVKKQLSQWDAFNGHPELGPRLRTELEQWYHLHENDETGRDWKERSDTVAPMLAKGGREGQHEAREHLHMIPPRAPRLGPDGGVPHMLASPWLGSFFHSNKVLPLDRDVPGLGKKGQVLVSNFVLTSVEVVRGSFVFDLSKGTLEARVLEGVLDGQHEPHVLPNGNVLVFDNRVDAPTSRVVEVNPATREVVWSYEAPDFHVPSEGAVFPMPNGNVLVTDTQRGRVFEVTRDKQVVWDYFRPVAPPVNGRPAMRGALHAVRPIPVALASKVIQGSKP